MGRIVEDSSTPVCFIYHQGWQGLIYGNIALKVRKHRIQGEKNGLALLTPAENYITQFNPARAGRAPRAPPTGLAGLIILPQISSTGMPETPGEPGGSVRPW